MAIGFSERFGDGGGVRNTWIDGRSTLTAELRNRLAMMAPTIISGQCEVSK